MSTLPVSQRQMVEIAKAVSYNAKVIVFDEPTSSLTEAEVEHLFRIIKKLRAEGVAIIYISHRMEEILKIADPVSIMRDGDCIRIDIPARSIQLVVADDELAARRRQQDAAGWKPAQPRSRQVSTALKAYALLATSADKGAVRDLALLDGGGGGVMV